MRFHFYLILLVLLDKPYVPGRAKHYITREPYSLFLTYLHTGLKPLCLITQRVPATMPVPSQTHASILTHASLVAKVAQFNKA